MPIIGVPTGYAEEGVEREANLRFQDASNYTEIVRETVEKLQIIADELSVVDPPEIGVPEKGFLYNPLEDQQKRILNNNLQPIYASQNAAQQQELQNVKIEECYENMVPLKKILTRKNVDFTVSGKPIVDACGSWAGMRRIMRVRETVAYDLVKVFRALNKVDLMPHLEDCWRHEQVQEGLFIRRLIAIARSNEQWNKETVVNIAKSLTASSPGVAGHQAGAAIDLRLRHTKDDQHFLPLGNEYPEGSAISSINFPYLTAEQWQTRTLYKGGMNMGGLRDLDTENWHASEGDRGLSTDGSVKMQTAHYGPIRNFDQESGNIIPYEAEDIDVLYLTPSEIEFILRLSRIHLPEGKEGFVYTQAQIIEAIQTERSRKIRGTSE